MFVYQFLIGNGTRNCGRIVLPSIVSSILRNTLTYKRSLSAIRWSTRVLHCVPFLGEVMGVTPSPVTGRLQGINPIGELMFVDGEARVAQLVPRIVPAVRKLAYGVNAAGKLFNKYADLLFGKRCVTKFVNSGVST